MCQSAPVRALVVPVCCERGLSLKNSLSDGVSVAPAALLSLSALVAAKLSEARVAPAASLPMAAAQPTIDLDESIAALAARAHVSAHNKDMLQDKMLQQGVGNVAELLTAIQGGTSATALGFSPAALALCERTCCPTRRCAALRLLQQHSPS